jgi:N-acetylglucosaminyl-diphospho-decaprenol L-rhamnosyltransferase
VLTETADISILVVAYKSRATIGNCMRALEAQNRKPREILVLENGSPVGERILASDLPDGVKLVMRDENLGFAAGNNLLAKLASSGWFAFLNPDAFARPHWVAELEVAIQRYPAVSLFGSTQYSSDSSDLLDGVGDVFHATGLAYRSGFLRPIALLPNEGEVFGPCGAAAMIRRSLFETLDGFDESLFCYSEDVDLAFRARLLGERAIQLRRAAVDHVGYASSGRRSEFATYYGVRNRLTIYLKNMPGWLLPVTLPFHVTATAVLSLGAIKNRQFRLFWHAIFDAMRRLPNTLAARKNIQSTRKVTTGAIARMMSWSSYGLLARMPDVRPYPDETIHKASPPAP